MGKEKVKVSVRRGEERKLIFEEEGCLQEEDRIVERATKLKILGSYHWIGLHFRLFQLRRIPLRRSMAELHLGGSLML